MSKLGVTTSTESIAFQDDRLFKELSLSFTTLRESVRGKGLLASVLKNMNEMVYKRLGLSVDIQLDDSGGHNVCVYISPLSDRHAMIRPHLQDYDPLVVLEDLQRNGGSLKGRVDINAAKVSGYFSTILFSIRVGTAIVRDRDITDAELAAILLHEIGHAFTYLEYINRTTTTNQALDAVARAVQKQDVAVPVTTVIAKASSVMGLKNVHADDLAASKNPQTVQIVLLQASADQVASQLGSNVTDFTSFEYLADQFAARMGAGRELAVVNAKLDKKFDDISTRGNAAYFGVEAFKAAMFLSGAVLGPVFGIPFATIAATMVALDANHETYDTPRDRMIRLRNQIVEQLKDKKLSKDIAAANVENLKTIDLMLEDISTRQQWFDYLLRAVSSSRRKADKHKALQTELEQLASNELFAKAASLRST